MGKRNDGTTSANELRQALEDLRTDAGSLIAESGTPEAVERVGKSLLGRSGRLTELLKQLGQIEPEVRPIVGALANQVRDHIEGELKVRLTRVRQASLADRLLAERIDMTAPGRPARIGHLHPTVTVERQLREIFHSFGFEVFEGPEVETEQFNFELLNIPADHPARDLWDTLYVAESNWAATPKLPAKDGTILRTHTSPVQIRAMRALQPPIRVIMPGRCFRFEAVDAGHNFEFFQVEGLVVDTETSMADLKGILVEFARALYGNEIQTRFRPGYYPFTEPSVAFDVRCVLCGGSGCPACKRTGWMTILGAGMVHPEVLRNGGLDPDEYQGYAFGMGLDRMTMLRYGIGDVRLLMGADLRLLEQFWEGR